MNEKPACVNCERETSLREIDEETEIEIGFYGMIKDADGARLVEDHEVPDFFDVVVRTTALESGDILTLFEFDDQNRIDANASLASMIAIFPKAPIDWHLGNEPDLAPDSGWKYSNVTAHNGRSTKKTPLRCRGGTGSIFGIMKVL